MCWVWQAEGEDEEERLYVLALGECSHAHEALGTREHDTHLWDCISEVRAPHSSVSSLTYLSPQGYLPSDPKLCVRVVRPNRKILWLLSLSLV